LYVLEKLLNFTRNFSPEEVHTADAENTANFQPSPQGEGSPLAQREEEGIVVSNLFVYNTFRLQTGLPPEM
jgi:hypothetical protein